MWTISINLWGFFVVVVVFCFFFTLQLQQLLDKWLYLTHHLKEIHFLGKQRWLPLTDHSSQTHSWVQVPVQFPWFLVFDGSWQAEKETIRDGNYLYSLQLQDMLHKLFTRRRKKTLGLYSLQLFTLNYFGSLQSFLVSRKTSDICFHLFLLVLNCKKPMIWNRSHKSMDVRGQLIMAVKTKGRQVFFGSKNKTNIITSTSRFII